MTYRLTPDLKEVVQQPTMVKPIKDWCVADGQLEVWEKEYYEHLATLPRFPARGFTEKHLGVDLREGEHFKCEHWCNNWPTLKGVDTKVTDTTIEKFKEKPGCEKCYLVAVATPATEETI